MEMLGEILIVLIVFGAIFGRGMLKSVLAHREKVREMELSKEREFSGGERDRMQQQIDALSERVEVLEKIVTDNKYQLEREIASL